MFVKALLIWISANPAVLTASNPAPDMSSSMPTITEKATYLKIDWPEVSDTDILAYKIYCDQNNPPATEVGTVAHPQPHFEVHGLSNANQYFVQIEPCDEFGAGAKSQINDGSPLKLDGSEVDVDFELLNSITITDSDGTAAETLAKLYDGNRFSDGVAITLSGTDKWIEYAYQMRNYFDRIGVWTGDDSARVYVGYSVDGVAWSYLKAEADHTTDADAKLLAAVDQADARTNYWQLQQGLNVAVFPENLTACHIRLSLTGTYGTTIYELVPSRILISELAAIEALSAISANIGTIMAGNLQSDDYDEDSGMNIDLDAKVIYLGGYANPKFCYDSATDTVICRGRFVFESGSSGYGNLNDKPTALAQINAGEGGKLSGIAAGATRNDLNQLNLTSGNLIFNSHFIAVGLDGRPAGVKAVNGNIDPSVISYQDPPANTVLKLFHPAASVGAAMSAFRVSPGTTYTVYIRMRSSIPGLGESANIIYDTEGNPLCDTEGNPIHDTAGGVFFRIAELDGELPAGVTHISSNEIFETGCIECARNITTFMENAALGDEWEEFTFEYTPTATAKWASPVVLNWLNMAASELHVDCIVVASNATDDSSWRHPSDITRIDGGKVYIGSQLRIGEGGWIKVGDENILLDSSGATGRMIIAPDGGPAVQDYVLMDQGRLDFMYYNPDSDGHEVYSSLKRIEAGTANQGQWTNIPGIWRRQPKIFVSPKEVGVYDGASPGQMQSIVCEVGAIALQPGYNNRWRFWPNCYLKLGNTEHTYHVDDINYVMTAGLGGPIIGSGAPPATGLESVELSIPDGLNMDRITITAKGGLWGQLTAVGPPSYFPVPPLTSYWFIKVMGLARLELSLKISGVWQTVAASDAFQLTINNYYTWIKTVSTPSGASDVKVGIKSLVSYGGGTWSGLASYAVGTSPVLEGAAYGPYPIVTSTGVQITTAPYMEVQFISYQAGYDALTTPMTDSTVNYLAIGE